MREAPHTVDRHALGDEHLLWELYYDTTHIVNGRDYTAAQCERWAPTNKNMKEWIDRIRSKNPFVARNQKTIVGFAELDSDGHIDYFYVHHAWTRKGVGRLLYTTIEAKACESQLPRLYTESSITAMPFFVEMGFTITEEQEHLICEAPAKRYLMEKLLRVANAA